MKTRTLVLALFIALSAWTLSASPILAQNRVFTLEELSQYDGKDGHPAYYAYEGVVYDVTNSPLWKLGQHFGHQAGQDLTGRLEGAPHGDDVVKAMPVVGTLGSGEQSAAPASIMPSPAAATVSPAAQVPQTVQQTQPQKPWYEGRIRILGISIVGWSGILLAIAFVLNFATCFALPWSKFPLPWSGSRPGPDKLDTVPTHKPWASIHKQFAWATVILGVIHGVLGLLQILGFYL